PARLRSRMPAETARHERTLIAWPTQRRVATLWDSQLEPARDTHAELARSLSRSEPVTVIAAPTEADDAARRCGDDVDVVALPIDDSWIRDSGPIIVIASDGTRRALHFRFNAWGDKYEQYDDDARVGALVAARLGLEVVEVPMVLEGGAIAV